MYTAPKRLGPRAPGGGAGRPNRRRVFSCVCIVGRGKRSRRARAAARRPRRVNKHERGFGFSDEDVESNVSRAWLSTRGKIGSAQVCVGRPTGLGRPGPNWDIQKIGWDGNRGRPSSAWAVPLWLGCPSFRLGCPTWLGCPSFRLGCLTWLGCPSLIWVMLRHTYSHTQTYPTCVSVATAVPPRSTASTTYKVHPRTICAPRLVSALLRGAYHTFGERCVARIAFGSRCTWALPGREARVHSLQFSCSQSSSKTTGWMVTLCRFAFLPGWGTGCGFL